MPSKILLRVTQINYAEHIYVLSSQPEDSNTPKIYVHAHSEASSMPVGAQQSPDDTIAHTSSVPTTPVQPKEEQAKQMEDKRIMAFPSRKALAFHFEFTQMEAAKLPIHILEFFCMLAAMLIISVMTPGAVVAEYQDNQAVVFAVQLLRSSDPRFQEGILLREAILERGR